MTEREQQVLALIRQNALISQDSIAAKLKISRSSVAGHIMRLAAKGVIKGRGYVLQDAPFTVVVGGANMDICGAPGDKLRLNDSNPGSVTVSPGGVGRNIAENLSRLGVQCRLITAVGADQHGDMLLQQGRAAGIDMGYILTVETEQTSTYVSILDERGDMLVGINDMSIIDHLTPERLLDHEAMLKQANMIIADTNLPAESLAYLAESCAAQSLLVDTVSVAKALKLLPYLSSVHTLKASLIEAAALTEMSGASQQNAAAMAKCLHGKGVARVFITLGPGGVYFSDGKAHGIEPVANEADVVTNANGAGDAFTAGLAQAWLDQRDIGDSVRYALSAARVALSHRATINPGMSPATVNRIYEENYATGNE